MANLVYKKKIKDKRTRIKVKSKNSEICETLVMICGKLFRILQRSILISVF